MAQYERQANAFPTNKAMAAASVAGLLTGYAQPVVAEVWPQIAPIMLSGEAMTGLISGLIGAIASLIVAWWIPDRAGEPL